MHDIVGHTNILLLTLDCLRLDVAQRCLEEERTPCLQKLLPAQGWQPRETPGTFTLPAHLAFFHGFLPTPLTPGPHLRLFALEFEGSETIGPRTFVFEDVPHIVMGFRRLGYRTLCIGGVGFFNKRNPLGNLLPSFFEESFWSSEVGVTCRDSTANQVQIALDWLGSLPRGVRTFLFMNISATHPPHAFYLPGATKDSLDSQIAALAYVDRCLPRLFSALRARGPCFCLLMADHGEAFGEDGRFGHRIAHPTVTTVPYADFVLF